MQHTAAKKSTAQFRTSPRLVILCQPNAHIQKDKTPLDNLVGEVRQIGSEYTRQGAPTASPGICAASLSGVLQPCPSSHWPAEPLIGRLHIHGPGSVQATPSGDFGNPSVSEYSLTFTIHL